MSQKTRHFDWRTSLRVTATWLVLVLGSAAVVLAGVTASQYAGNRSKLERMNDEQRRVVWQKYQHFLALPPAEQQRIRQLHADLQRLPSDQRERYRGIMDRYMKWRDTLPLYQKQMLEDAASGGSAELYATFRDVQSRQEAEDRLRPYWLLPDRAGLRTMLPRIMSKLSTEEIELLDQTPPMERTEKLFAYGQQHLGMELPPFVRSGRFRPRGPLPDVDPEKLREFVQKLPRDQLWELSDLGMRQAIQHRKLLELYYEKHPEELQERIKREGMPPGAGQLPPRPPIKERAAPESGQPRPRDDSEQPPPSGKIGIKPPSS